MDVFDSNPGEGRRTATMVARQFHRGWQDRDRSKIQLHEDMYFSDGEEKYSSAEEFLEARWKFSGRPFENIQYISDNKGTLCARYEIANEDGTTSAFCEIITVEDEKVAMIEVFHAK